MLHLPLPIIIDDNIINLSSGINSVQMEDSVHESLEQCGGPKQPKRKGTTTTGGVSLWCSIRLVQLGRGEDMSENSACNLAMSVIWDGKS